MNKNTSLQRKMLYLGGIILLFIPIIGLGLPAPPAAGQEAPTAAGGGVLARMRVEHDLGESSLGKVDPASATMNLLLLGMRGVATSMLWMDAQEQQKTKNWAQLRATTDSIIMLQPHFLKVWNFQGWNLAYNVSAEWDAVSDRYYWVKEGIKFYKKGVARNKKYPELYWYTGDTLGKKIGRSDEWVQFRRFFKDDPDKQRYPSGLDRDVNLEGKDNYEVAKGWFEEANETSDRFGHEQRIMARVLFRGYPQRAQMDYASTLQKEGKFDEVTKVAWVVAFNEWTKKYGMEEFESPGGMIRLEVTPADAADMKKRGEDVKLFWVDRYQDMTNYRYWRTRALCEGESNTVEAHRLLHQGEQAYLNGAFTDARKLLEEGMTRYEKMLQTYPDLYDDDMSIEEGLMAQLLWRACLQLDEEEIPEKYPLQQLWQTKQGHIGAASEELERRRRRFK